MDFEKNLRLALEPLCAPSHNSLNIDKVVEHVIDSSLFAKKKTSLEQSVHFELDVKNKSHLEHVVMIVENNFFFFLMIA